MKTVEEALLDGAFDIKDEKRGISEALGGCDVLTPVCIKSLAMIYAGRDKNQGTWAGHEQIHREGFQVIPAKPLH